MKERVRFAVGAASMVLAACCLMGALFTAWLRCAAGAVTQAEIDALKAEQAESAQRQEELEAELEAVKDDQAKAQQQRKAQQQQNSLHQFYLLLGTELSFCFHFTIVPGVFKLFLRFYIPMGCSMTKRRARSLHSPGPGAVCSVFTASLPVHR